MCTCKECKGITIINGSDGVGIVSITDNGDGTFTILMSNGNTFISPDYTGPQGIQGIQGLPGINGTNGTNGTNGVGITSIVWTSNSGGQPQGTQGTTDTYTITLSDASTYNFLVTNGADGVPGGGMGIQNFVEIDASAPSGAQYAFVAAANTAYYIKAHGGTTQLLVETPNNPSPGDVIEVYNFVDKIVKIVPDSIFGNTRVGVFVPGGIPSYIEAVTAAQTVTYSTSLGGDGHVGLCIKLVCMEATGSLVKWMITSHNWVLTSPQIV